MKTRNAARLLALLVLSGLLMGADAGRAEETDVAKNPSLFLAPSAKASDLEVYGVKLGDAMERIPTAAGVTRRSGDRPQEALYIGANVTYYAYNGTVYQIKVYGEITKAMPPYNATRLQMSLGMADDVSHPEAGTTCLTYYTNRLQFTFVGDKNVATVDLYAP